MTTQTYEEMEIGAFDLLNVMMERRALLARQVSDAELERAAEQLYIDLHTNGGLEFIENNARRQGATHPSDEVVKDEIREMLRSRGWLES